MTAAAHPRPDLPAIDTANAPRPRGHYSQARIAGDLIFTAGLVPIDPETRSLVGEGDVAEQTRQVFRKVAAIEARWEAVGPALV